VDTVKRKPETDQDLIDVLADLFEHDEANESIEEVDEELRAVGLDPEEVGAKIAAIAEEAYRRSPLNWRQRARAERIEAEGRLRERSRPGPPGPRDEVVRQINVIVARSPGVLDVPRVQAHFRNFDSATDEDLVDLLAELEFLEGEEASSEGE
jgi:hypothetical protein